MIRVVLPAHLRNLADVASGRVEPTQVAGGLGGEPHSAIDGRRHVVGMRARRNGVLLHARLRRRWASHERNREEEKQARQGTHAGYCRTWSTA